MKRAIYKEIPKIVLIVANEDNLYALDEYGHVWRISQYSNGWKRIDDLPEVEVEGDHSE